MSDAVTCILVVYPDGSECFEPLDEYLRNPPSGTWIKRESRKCIAERVS